MRRAVVVALTLAAVFLVVSEGNQKQCLKGTLKGRSVNSPLSPVDCSSDKICLVTYFSDDNYVNFGCEADPTTTKSDTCIGSKTDNDGLRCKCASPQECLLSPANSFLKDNNKKNWRELTKFSNGDCDKTNTSEMGDYRLAIFSKVDCSETKKEDVEALGAKSFPIDLEFCVPNDLFVFNFDGQRILVQLNNAFLLSKRRTFSELNPCPST